MALVKFFNYTKSQFETAVDANGGNGGLTEGGLYFISDVGVILRAKSQSQYDKYGAGVQLTTSTALTTLGASNATPGIIYIETDTWKGKVVSGNSFQTVFAPSTAPTGAVAEDDGAAVTGGTVHDYIHNDLGLTEVTHTGGSSYASRVVILNDDGLIDDTMLNLTTAGGSGHGGEIPKLNDSGVLNVSLIDAVDTSTANKIVKLDGTGKINSNMLPEIALSKYIQNTTGSRAALNSLVAEDGDWSEVTNPGVGETESDIGSYIKSGNNWIKLGSRHDTTSSIENTAALIKSSAVYNQLSWQ